MLERASAFRREQKRPVAVGAWDPGSAVAAIRESLPGFQTWAGPQSPQEAGASAPPDRKPRRVETAPIGVGYEKFVKMTLPQLVKEQVGPFDEESERVFLDRVDKNNDHLVDRKELQSHRAEHWPTKSEL